MITVITNQINTLDQISYNKFIDSINYCNLECSCGIANCFNIHGYYYRYVKSIIRKISLQIQRVKCKHCNKTHSIFPHIIVPYSQILLPDQISIIAANSEKKILETIMTNNESIDESNIRHIVKQHSKYWKERILSIGLTITDDILTLSEKCLREFKKQFMQIKYIPNILSKQFI